MSAPPDRDAEADALARARRNDHIADLFERAWQLAGPNDDKRPAVETYCNSDDGMLREQAEWALAGIEARRG